MIRRFLRSSRAGAAGITAAVVTVMAVGGAALISDHVWLVDQRDVLKTGADAAAVAATLEMKRLPEDLSDARLTQALFPVAERYVKLNLAHLPEDRYARALETLVVELSPDRSAGTVEVTARADLGGTLFASRLPLFGGYTDPEAIEVDAGVECVTNVVEVVLAFDVTASMHDRVGGQRKIQATVRAANALLDVLYAGCGNANVAVGIVPWDKTVRLDEAAARRWRTGGWVDLASYRTSSSTDDSAWGGCLEDRLHDVDGSRTDAPGLSLALPSRAQAFPAFFNPNTLQQDSRVVQDAAAEVLSAFSQLSETDASDVREILRQWGDNDWGEPMLWLPGERAQRGRNRHRRAGPSAQCTESPMLALSSNQAEVRERVELLDDRLLWGGGTMGHLGVTWARRMLSPEWRTVWGQDTHPVDASTHPDGEVTKAIVLLTDGANALVDQRRGLPGEIGVRLGEDRVLLPGCDTGGRRGCERIGERRGTTRYSALGRLSDGPAGRAEDGHVYAPDADFWGTARQNFRQGLDRLLESSCGLAHEEGLAVYTVFIGGAREAALGTSTMLLEGCAGAAGVPESGRRAFHFEADDPESLAGAFREVGHRLLGIRRIL